jgi:hypothetical protein
VGTLTSAGATAALSLFLRTESRAVIKAELTLGSHKVLMYITAFRNKPYVQIIHNWYFNDASATAMFSLTDLSIRLMTEITGTRTITVSRGAADTVLSTAAGDGAELSFTTNDTYGIRNGTSTVATGKGMTAAGVFEEKRVGWLHASASGKGIGAGIRFMWQMAPKLIELKSTGELIIGLYRYSSAAQVYYGGNGRTHTAVVSFGGNAGDMKEAYYAITQPLYAVAPPVWYCGMTQCLGKNIVHGDPNLFATDAALRTQFAQFFSKYRMVYQMFGHAYRRAPLLAVNISDLYHFIRFGNCTDQQQSCGGQHYSNNYYDFPHLAILGLIMGGAPENLELAWIHDMHQMDLNLDNVSGDCKGCPGVDIWDGYQSCSPTWWGNANHWKAQSFFENWYLTGEPILKDFGIRACQKPMTSSFMGGEHRSTGHILEGLSAAYEATWDVSYRDRMRVYYLGTIDSRTTTPTNNYFQNGIVGEGLMYQTFADPEYTHAVEQLKNWGDFEYANQAEYVWGGYIGQCCWLLNGFSVLRDNYPSDTRYQVLADSIWNWYWVNGQTNSTRAKFFNEQYRGPAHYLKFRLLNQNYLSNYPDYANIQGPIAAERTIATPPPITLEAVPNPLRSSAVIRAGGLRGPAGLCIYNLNGRLVCDATKGLKDGAYTWDAKGMASGVYVAVLKTGTRRVERKITLLR